MPKMSHSAKAIKDRQEQEKAGKVRRGAGVKAPKPSQGQARKKMGRKLAKRMLKVKT